MDSVTQKRIYNTEYASGGIRSADGDDKSRIIEHGYKYVHAYAKSLKLSIPQIIFRGIDNIAYNADGVGHTKVACARIEYGLSYETPNGNAKTNVILHYAGGNYEIDDDRDHIPINGEQYKEIPGSITPVESGADEPTRGDLIDQLSQYFSSHPEKAKQVLDVVDDSLTTEAMIAVLDNIPKEEVEKLATQFLNTEPMMNGVKQASMKTAQQMEMYRPMIPIDYMAERIARMVEKMPGREPQSIYDDFVKTNYFMTPDLAEELAYKVRQLGFYVEPPKSTNWEDHTFSMPADMIGENKYLGNDMRDKKFTDRFHKNSPETKPQTIDTAGDPRPKPRGIFAQIMAEMGTDAVSCDHCDTGEMVYTHIRNGAWKEYECNHCGHKVSIESNVKTAATCQYCDVEMEPVPGNDKSYQKYRCPHCGSISSEYDKQEASADKQSGHFDELMGGRRDNTDNNHDNFGPDPAGVNSRMTPDSGYFTGAQLTNRQAQQEQSNEIVPGVTKVNTTMYGPGVVTGYANSSGTLLLVKLDNDSITRIININDVSVA